MYDCANAGQQESKTARFQHIICIARWGPIKRCVTLLAFDIVNLSLRKRVDNVCLGPGWRWVRASRSAGTSVAQCELPM